MKRSGKYWMAMLIMLIMLTVSGQTFSAAAAKFTKNSDGTWVFTDSDGEEHSAVYYAGRGKGIVRYSDSVYYLIDSSGNRCKGQFTTDDGIRYFRPTNYQMVIGKRVRIGKYYYRFDANGIMLQKKWYGRYYYAANGRQQFSRWVGRRYLNSKGAYVTGLATIKGTKYYFQKANGYKVTDRTLTISGQKYYFDSEGRGTVVFASNGRTAASVTVEKTYYTDPVPDDETLLAAIIYCEAGNQTAAGKMAVGLVITNRLRTSGFPNRLEEVIYAKSQFSPCADGSMTRALKNPALVKAAGCDEIAKKVLELYRTNKYKITLDSGKSKSMKGYLFFMTPAAYQRLKLSAKYYRIGGHVFFKTWS